VEQEIHRILATKSNQKLKREAAYAQVRLEIYEGARTGTLPVRRINEYIKLRVPGIPDSGRVADARPGMEGSRQCDPGLAEGRSFEPNPCRANRSKLSALWLHRHQSAVVGHWPGVRWRCPRIETRIESAPF
jgi:hypothetical protein